MLFDRGRTKSAVSADRLLPFAAIGCLVAAAFAASGDEVPGIQPAPASAKPESNPTVDKDHAAKMAEGLALFKKQVRPALVGHCLKCHGGAAVESEFDLNDRDKLLRGGASGKVAEPGKAKAGSLYERLTHARKPGMPFKGDRLPDEIIAGIAAWIDLGAPYDAPLIAATSPGASWIEKTLAPEAREFWSYRPLRRVDPPRVGNDDPGRTAVDRFVLEK